jgi:uncharacterized protein
MHNTKVSSDAAWWKFGHVWMVIAGPAIVVVASFITLYLAVKGMDPVLDESTYQKSMQVSKALAANQASLAPAMQGRNHAQTGVQPNPKTP